MKNIRAQAAIAVALTANLSVVSAASPAIGVVFSSGNVLINNTTTMGNASLFDGSTVETNAAGSRLSLKNGAAVQLSSESRGKVFANRMVLEKGVIQFKSAGKYGVEARSLQITGTDANSSAQISIHGAAVQVASLTGHMRVANSTGVTVATIAPGMAFDFTPQDQGASAPSSSSGKKGASGAGAAGGGAAAGAGLSSTAIVIGAVVVVAAVASTVGVLASQGESNTAINGISPAAH